ncbi:Hypothetical protein PBC10988_15830 [Planctomycetales bacterium 10988]|nr:Hypothetical protein PBC10988_15830 [Planctomycetales bacterium 10988]
MVTVLFVTIGLALLVVGAYLAKVYAQNWGYYEHQAKLQEDWPDVDRNKDLPYLRASNRRRFQMSAMIAVLGVGLLVGGLLTPESQPIAFLITWCGVLLLGGWILLLAFGDLISTRRRSSKEVHAVRVEEAQLRAELDQIRKKLATEQEPPSGDVSN